jgi:hypothetical protein
MPCALAVPRKHAHDNAPTTKPLCVFMGAFIKFAMVTPNEPS